MKNGGSACSFEEYGVLLVLDKKRAGRPTKGDAVNPVGGSVKRTSVPLPAAVERRDPRRRERCGAASTSRAAGDSRLRLSHTERQERLTGGLWHAELGDPCRPRRVLPGDEEPRGRALPGVCSPGWWQGPLANLAQLKSWQKVKALSLESVEFLGAWLEVTRCDRNVRVEGCEQTRLAALASVGSQVHQRISRVSKA